MWFSFSFILSLVTSKASTRRCSPVLDILNDGLSSFGYNISRGAKLPSYGTKVSPRGATCGIQTVVSISLENVTSEFACINYTFPTRASFSFSRTW